MFLGPINRAYKKHSRLYSNSNEEGPSSLAADLFGIILDKFLEVVRRVILGLEEDDVHLGGEEAAQHH